MDLRYDLMESLTRIIVSVLEFVVKVSDCDAPTASTRFYGKSLTMYSLLERRLLNVKVMAVAGT